MGRILRALTRLATVAVTLGLLQAVVETLVFAVLYRGLLFAPYRFFTTQSYDGFTKLYFAADSVVPLPLVLERFLADGVAAKLALLPDLAAVSAATALVVAAVISPFAGLLGLSDESPRRAFVARAVIVLMVVQLVVHAVWWLASVKIPLDPTVVNVSSNLARDALFDGVLVAVAVLAASSLAVTLLRPRAMHAVAGLLVAAVAAAVPAVGAPGRAVAPAVEPSDQAPATGYNVVLISIDSLRADHLSAYGYERPTSPAIDALAAQGTLFERCAATTSWTLPSHMSMLTGRSLLGHGVTGDDRRLSDRVPTLAESFSDAGYATGAVVSAPYVESRFGFGRGFDDYDDRTISFATNNESYKSVTAPLVNATAEKWIDANRDRPFFLFLHYWDVHYDYAPGAPYDTMFDPDYDGAIDGDDFYFNPAVNVHMDRRDLDHVLALYDGEIRLVDDHVALLRAALERRGLAERTIIVVTSDHGEEFFEHGRKGHHRTLYEEVLRVPLVVFVPSLDAAGQRVTADTSIIDIAPTLLGLTGVAQPEGVEGVDLTSVITGRAEAASRFVFGEMYRKGSLNVQVSAQRGPDKLIHHFNRRIVERYDLAADGGEARVLHAREGAGSELMAGMLDWLNDRWKRFDRRNRAEGTQDSQIDEATQEALRSLGYIQ